MAWAVEGFGSRINPPGPMWVGHTSVRVRSTPKMREVEAMPEDKNRFPLANMSTRRQVIAGVAVAFGRLAAGSEVCAEAPQQDTKRSFPTAAHRSRTSLHQEVDF